MSLGRTVTRIDDQAVRSAIVYVANQRLSGVTWSLIVTSLAVAYDESAAPQLIACTHQAPAASTDGDGPLCLCRSACSRCARPPGPCNVSPVFPLTVEGVSQQQSLTAHGAQAVSGCCE